MASRASALILNFLRAALRARSFASKGVEPKGIKPVLSKSIGKVETCEQRSRLSP